MSTPGAPAGWHPDPHGGPGLRYYDGTQWTEHMAPGGPPPQRPGWNGQQYSQPKQGGGKRWLIIAAGIVLVLLVIGAVIGGSQDDDSDGERAASSDTTQAEEAPDTTEPEATPETTTDTGIDTDSRNTENPPTADVSPVECRTDQFGYMEATGTVTNHSSERSDYSITVAFESPDGTRQLGTGTAYIQNLEPGQSTALEAGGFEQAQAGTFTCRVTEVERYASF